MKKAFFSINLLLCLVFALTGCGKKSKTKGEVALITDIGTVEDGSFNQACYEGIKEYCEAHGVSYTYYQPADTSEESYNKMMKKAVKNKAKVIVCPGNLLEQSVYDLQKKYSKVKFILVDGDPHNEDYSDTSIADNVLALHFAEAEAGFLAGYSAVRDGYTKLGFMGGQVEEPIIRFGYGFCQGADYAAIEMGNKIEINYTYTGTYFADPNVKALADSWYQNGTQVIFACGGEMGKSVMASADEIGGKVIGVDVDQSNLSPSVITSAKKMIANAIVATLDDIYNDRFTGGRAEVLSAKNNGIGLEIDNSRFNTFSEVEYNAIFTELVDGKILPYDATDVGTTAELEFVNATVNYIE